MELSKSNGKLSNKKKRKSLNLASSDPSPKWTFPRYIPNESVELQPLICRVQDAVFLRRYLVEYREKESPEAIYSVGDLVWAKADRKDRPWWPAMICVHPQRDYYLKYCSDEDILYHVQYFGSQPIIEWISTDRLKPFKGFDKFKQSMHAEIKAYPRDKIKEILISYLVSVDLMGQLNEAIAQAEEALKLTQQERLITLTYRYYSIRYSRFFD